MLGSPRSVDCNRGEGMKVGDISKLAAIELQTISPDRPVQEAVARLVERNIGALPVCEQDGRVVGIITERDVLRLVADQPVADAMGKAVGEIMTRDLVIGVPDDDIGYVMRVMTEHRIRHLPILDGERLVGIISIGDVVKAKMEESSTELRFLRDYVAG